MYNKQIKARDIISNNKHWPRHHPTLREEFQTTLSNIKCEQKQKQKLENCTLLILILYIKVHDMHYLLHSDSTWSSSKRTFETTVVKFSKRVIAMKLHTVTFISKHVRAYPSWKQTHNNEWSEFPKLLNLIHLLQVN